MWMQAATRNGRARATESGSGLLGRRPEQTCDTIPGCMDSLVGRRASRHYRADRPPVISAARIAQLAVLTLALAWWMFVMAVSANAAASYVASGTCVTGDDVYDFTPSTGNDWVTLVALGADLGYVALDVRYFSDDALLHPTSYYAGGAVAPHAALYVACAADGDYNFTIDLAESYFGFLGHVGQTEATNGVARVVDFFTERAQVFGLAALALIGILTLPVMMVRGGLRLATSALARLRPR